MKPRPDEAECVRGMLYLMTTIPLVDEDDPYAGAHVYVEQGAVGQDLANLVICEGNCVMNLCFLNAASLDKLSLFLAEAATKLRYCTKETTP